VTTALLSLMILLLLFRWNSLNSLACANTAFKYSWRKSC
jgi:hypothetical protein